MEVANIFSNQKTNNIYGLMGNINLSTTNINYKIIRSSNFKGTVQDYLNSPKAASSLKMLNLPVSLLNQTCSNLSLSLLKRINLAKALLENKKYLVLDYFEKGLNYQEKAYFQRLFKKISQEYSKTIIVFTNDITFLWPIASSITYVTTNNTYQTYDIKDYSILKNIDEPMLIQFINLLKKQNLKIAYYQNSSDLLKAIYRLKEWN